jgi:hypothetical protein
MMMSNKTVAELIRIRIHENIGASPTLSMIANENKVQAINKNQ